MALFSPSRQDMKAACGPPNPMGTPKRCAEPMAMSAPIAPGSLTMHRASRSVAITDTPPAARTAAQCGVRSRTCP